MDGVVAPQSGEGALTRKDYEKMAARRISPDMCHRAGIRRVDSIEGARIVGRPQNTNYAGLIIPYRLPESDQAREYRLRRDYPDIERRFDGSEREINKYLSPPERSPKLYFAPGIKREWLADPNIPIVIVEGEFKALCLMIIALEFAKDGVPPFIPIGLAGVWAWRGKVGRTPAPDVGWQDVKGPLPDFDLIEWGERKVIILFDSNVHTNEKVRKARKSLAWEIHGRTAVPLFADMPKDCGVNGPDDLAGRDGPEIILRLIGEAYPAIKPVRAATPRESEDERRARAAVLRSFADAARAKSEGRDSPERTIEREVSESIDMLNFIYARSKCPATVREFINAVIGAVQEFTDNGQEDEWFEVNDFRMGLRLRGDTDRVSKGAIKKTTQRARKECDEWQKANGYVFVESENGGQKDHRNFDTRYRIPLLTILVEEMLETRASPQYRRDPSKAIKDHSKKALRRLEGTPVKRERFNRPRRDDEAVLNRDFKTILTLLRKDLKIIARNGGDPQEYIERLLREGKTALSEMGFNSDIEATRQGEARELVHTIKDIMYGQGPADPVDMELWNRACGGAKGAKADPQ